MSKLQTKILDVLLVKKAYAVKVVNATRSGVSDITVCYRGVYIGIEVKEAKDTMKRLQSHNLDMVEAAGGFALEARSVQQVVDLLDDIDALLAKLKE